MEYIKILGILFVIWFAYTFVVTMILLWNIRYYKKHRLIGILSLIMKVIMFADFIIAANSVNIMTDYKSMLIWIVTIWMLLMIDMIIMGIYANKINKDSKKGN